MILRGYFFSLLYGVLCILIALVAYKLGMQKRYTRKIIHILVGFEWVILFHHFGTDIHFLIIALIFTALLVVTHFKKLLPMMSSDGENAPGTVYYGISMSLMALVSFFIPDFVFPFGIAVFCTSIGDGFAAVIGAAVGKFGVKIYKEKTLVGCCSAFVFSLISILVFSYVYELNVSLWHAVAISVLATGLELVTGYGLDNITLPIGTSIFSFLIIYYPSIANEYIIPVILTPFVIAVVLKKGILTAKGVLVAVIMDIAVSLALGNFGFVLLLSFLALSVVVDKVKKHFKRSDDQISKKGEKRDEMQVLANGVIPMAMAICYILTKEIAFVVAYTAALAEAFSDTCASGIGVISSSSAYDVFRMKRVTSGISGGMTLAGTLASLAAAFSFPLIAVAFGVISWQIFVLIGACAFCGAVFDSFLGSMFQAKFRCTVCGIVTEKNFHCEKETVLCSGKKLITNDAVNLASTLFAAALSALLYVLIFM